MAKTFFFYDLETSGLNPREDRIMQFAGQRTDSDFNPIGDPYNMLVTLSDDTLPSPEALLVTGIMPQKTRDEGYSEAEFTKILQTEIFTPDTIVTGFNSIRFDDEFIRHLLWRNFYDPYEWAYADGRSRWDVLDVIRMTRALRPDDIVWPFTEEGTPTNRLELITSLNGIEHTAAHDALSDVVALIGVAKLIKQKQPQLYEYLLKMRDKNEVKKLVNLDDKRPFVYTSGRYENEHMKTTVAFPLTSGRNSTVVVYDLRYDPSPFVTMSEKEIHRSLTTPYAERNADDYVKLPIKEFHYNRAPAVAPLGVLEQGGGWDTIHLDKETIEKHLGILLGAPDFAERVRACMESIPKSPASSDPEARLYEGFLDDRDRLRVRQVRELSAAELAGYSPEFSDERLAPLLLHYKARNFPSALSESEAVAWEEWRTQRIARQMSGYVEALQRIMATSEDSKKEYVASELQLWLESVMPADYE